jgi:hypothetical protein
MRMLAYLPVSLQTQDMNRQRLAIPERAWREQAPRMTSRRAASSSQQFP